MTDQKTPLKTYPCHSETGCLDHTKPCDICNVPKDIELEIQQLKKDCHDTYENFLKASSTCVELEKQIETRKKGEN